MSDSAPLPSTARLRGIHAEGSTRLLSNRVLQPKEYWWRDHQKWLEEKGYMLRPRFRPEWVPSWGEGEDIFFKNEDSIFISREHIIDATRVSDGELVMLKRISKSVHPFEVEITQFFSTEPIASHPHNHCVPLYDALEVPDEPDTVVLVTPFLRALNNPRMQTIGEVVEFFRQIFQGLQFIHHCHVSHRDCMNLNIMMDPRGLYPEMFHPEIDFRSRDFKGTAKHFSRTARPVKYYFIDFGISRRFNPEDGPPREIPIMGGDKSAPELQEDVGPLDPFPTDIYYLGNMIRKEFFEESRGVEFIQPLVAEMVQDDPSKRPTIDEVVERYDAIRRSLSWWTLRSRIQYVDEDEFLFLSSFRAIKHLFHTSIHLLTFRSAVPTPYH